METRLVHRAARVIILICTIAFIAESCAPAQTPPATHVSAPWSYDGDTGPAHWDKLDPEYATCGYGTTQSPIDIANPASEDLPGVVFHYQPSALKFYNTGHTIQIDVAPGNSIEANGETYDLVAIHVHAPSEHSIAGKHADAELQFVHRNAAGQLAIVAVLLRIGQEDKVLHEIWNNLPPAAGPARTIQGDINVEKLLPARRLTYRYEGSLTTPPCDEVVAWLVMRDPMQIGATQLEGFAKLFKNNNRPVQRLNHRKVVEDASFH